MFPFGHLKDFLFDFGYFQEFIFLFDFGYFQ